MYRVPKNIVYNCNYFFSDRIPLPLYSLAILVLLLVLFAFFHKRICGSLLSLFGFALVALGGGYNIFSRLVLGCVADFIDLGVSYVNVADLVIFVGLVLIFVAWFFYDKSTIRR